jgi:hypothetical protein
VKVYVVFSRAGKPVAGWFDEAKAVKFMNKYQYPRYERIEVRDDVVGGVRASRPPREEQPSLIKEIE